VPGSGRKFTELYNVQQPPYNRLDPLVRVCIGTTQRVYSLLRGEAELPEDLDEESGYELAPDRPMEVTCSSSTSATTLAARRAQVERPGGVCVRSVGCRVVGATWAHDEAGHDRLGNRTSR
jgi:hypothetical protein